MPYTETLAGKIITLDLKADGTLRAANVERRYTTSMNGEPRPDVFVRDVITADTIAAECLPHASMLLRIADDEATIGNLRAAADDAARQLANQVSANATLQAEVARLTEALAAKSI